MNRRRNTSCGAFALLRTAVEGRNIAALNDTDRTSPDSGSVWLSRRRVPTLATAILLLALAPLPGNENRDTEPEELRSLSAPVLLAADAETGTILFERNADAVLPTASLAKLMTLYLSFEEISSGEISGSELFEVPEGGRAVDMRPSSSVLGLQTGDRLSYRTLQRAAAVISANDAAWSLALISSPSVEEFVDRMNRKARDLGMSDTVYADPDGWSSLSATTGRDQMTMALSYIRQFPQALTDLHSLESLSFMPQDRIAATSRLKNTNLLIGRYPGADGLKTGTIPSAGFHFIATAEREGSRFVALVMGLRRESYRDSLIARAEEAAAVLDWLFGNYVTWRPPDIEAGNLPVRHGRSHSTPVSTGKTTGALTLQRSEAAMVEPEVHLPGNLTAPISAGQELGYCRWLLNDREIGRTALIADENVERRWRLRDFLGLEYKIP